MKKNEKVKMLNLVLRSKKKLREEFQEELRKLEKENKEKIPKLRPKDILTVKDIIYQYQMSRKTIDRWRQRGLKVSQKSYKSAIRIKRSDLEEFLNKEEYYVR